MAYAVCPLDGRYKSLVDPLREHVSEEAYIKHRVVVELRYLTYLAKVLHLPCGDLTLVPENISEEDIVEIKSIEAVTRHDVKAIEMFLRRYIKRYLPEFAHEQYIHFALTSQDANSLGYMIGYRGSVDTILSSTQSFLSTLQHLITSVHSQHIVMMARTHGQPAVPTYFSKELYVKYNQIHHQYKQVMRSQTDLTAKFGGAVGNFSAHYFAYPDVDWMKFADEFVASFGFQRSQFTTQIDDYTSIYESLNHVKLLATYSVSFVNYARNLIRDEYFRQAVVAEAVGSSTMPQKVNPVDFENSVANLQLSEAMITSIQSIITSVQDQRDMSDSSALRSLGTAFGYLMVGITNMNKGTLALTPNIEKIASDLAENPVIIMEGIQTYMKTQGIADAYERIKELSRGRKLSMSEIQEYIQHLDVDEAHKLAMLSLTPEAYAGKVPNIAFDTV